MKAQGVRRELAMEMVVGTFTFVVLLALGYFTIVMGRSHLFQKQYPLEVSFDNVMGLRRNDDVIMRGTKVGDVAILTLMPDRVAVTLNLDQPVVLKTDYHVRVITSSILGGRYLEIDAGSPAAAPLPPGTAVHGETPLDLMGDAAEAVAKIKHALEEGGVLTNLENTVASVREIASGIQNGKGTIGKLVNDDSVYNDLKGVMADLKQAGDQLKTITDQLGSGQGTLGKLLSKDDSLYTNLSAAVVSLKDVAERIQRGEGSVGKIVKDDTLYNDLKAGIDELRAAIDDFRETSPVVSFSSLLLGQF